MDREGPAQVLIDVMQPLTMFSLLEVVFILSFAFTKYAFTHKPPRKPPVCWRWPFPEPISKLLRIVAIKVAESNDCSARKLDRLEIVLTRLLHEYLRSNYWVKSKLHHFSPLVKS